MVAGLRGSDYEERCAELGLETLEERRQSQDMALVHKMMNNGQGASMFEFARNDNNGVKDKTSSCYPWTCCAVCQNRHKEILFCSPSGGTLESPAGHIEKGSKQGSFQERVEATEKRDSTRDQNWLSEKTT
jgi:hypothetical protein